MTSEVSTPPPTLVQTETALPITGMSCASCALTIETALRGLPGVVEASVNLTAEKAFVRFTPDAVTLEDMARVIRDVGYE
ncbi:MAG TPA: heavy metal-associated domain-containing protein, partial [bacterium]